jgi:hypothetical protein
MEITKAFNLVDEENKIRRTIAQEIMYQQTQILGDIPGYDCPEFLIQLRKYYIAQLQDALKLSDAMAILCGTE